MTAVLEQDVCGEDGWEFEQPSADDWAAVCTLRPVRDMLTIFANLDWRELSAAGKVDALIALRRIKCWAAAQEHLVVADMVAHTEQFADPVDASGKQWVREDI